MSPDWTRSACKDVDPERFFVEGQSHTAAYRREVAAAVAVCEACPIRTDCLAFHLAAEQGTPERGRYGIVGGLTALQRARMDTAVPRPHLPPVPPCGPRNGVCGSPGRKRGIDAHKGGPLCPPCAEHAESTAARAAELASKDAQIIALLDKGLGWYAVQCASFSNYTRIRSALRRADERKAA